MKELKYSLNHCGSFAGPLRCQTMFEFLYLKKECDASKIDVLYLPPDFSSLFFVQKGKYFLPIILGKSHFQLFQKFGKFVIR
jgi:hypothetical protein